MKEFEGCFKGYMLNSSMDGMSLPAGATEQIYIGLYHIDGGTAGELCIQWGNHSPLLHVYQADWKALYSMQDVLNLLAELDGKEITPEKFIKKLKALGFRENL